MIPFAEPLYVSRPLMPPLGEVVARIEEVWASRWLTNGGTQHERLETALRLYLGAGQLSLFNNGTIALLTAIRALGLRGSVLTTPFTFPATPHALSWSGIEPVFCDIDSATLTIDAERVEQARRSDTTGILAVHVYGVPCDVVRLGELADRHSLRLLYDGAHAFGTTIAGVGIGTFGDATMFSFHATKLFHTAEGGALATQDARLKALFDHLKNFGICNQEEVDVPGINGKMNELQAALGLAVLDHVPGEVQRRRALVARYREHLDGVEGLTLVSPPAGVGMSHQYFVVRVERQAFGASRDEVQASLRTYNVLTRKYFYPLCSDYACYRGLPSAAPANLPVARRVAEEALCLPIYGDLPLDAVDRICEMLLAARGVSSRRGAAGV